MTDLAVIDRTMNAYREPLEPATGMIPLETCGSRSAVMPKNRRALTVSAPDLERAMCTLNAAFKRDPNHAELAAELRIGQQDLMQFCEYLKELETGIFLATQEQLDDNKEAALSLSRPGDDPFFRCLRFETESMMQDAIQHLPACEQLLLSCHFENDCNCNSKSMNIKLEQVDTTVGELRAAAFIQVRVSLEDRRRSSKFRSRPWWQTSPGPVETRLFDLKVRNSKELNQDDEQPLIHVTGSQSGWIPSSRSWKLLGWREQWDRFSTSWYCMNEKHELVPTWRQERYKRELGFA